MLPFLRAISDGQPHTIRDLTDRVSDELKLTPDERLQTLASGQRVIANRVGWARTYMKKAGLLESPKRGVMVITDRGQQLLAEEVAVLDAALLKQRYPEFVEWFKAKPQPDVDIPEIPDGRTPDDRIEAAHKELLDQVASDLLDSLKQCSPYFFEKVVVQLLRAMGYGGVSGRGLVTPKSGDGGIDGVIYEDKLGLDNVCIQAKRWEGTVGRKTVQEFVGSMDFYRSRKGVIFTTSSFSKDAQEYIDRIEGKKVVLIDGAALTRFMIDHKVGVTTTRTYEVVDVSQDFFDEEI